MRNFYISFLALGLLSEALAQDSCLTTALAIPSCGTSCIISAASGAGCSSTDFACQCSKSAQLQNEAQNCVISACGISTALEVVSSVSAVCACASASPTGGSSGSATSTAAPASSASSSGPAATASAGSTSSAVLATSTSSAANSSATSGSASQCSSQIAAVPSCAVKPLTAAAATIGCGETDYACWCQNADALDSAASSDVASACGSQVADVLTATDAVCKCIQGGTSSSSNGSGCSTTSQGSSGVSSASSAGGGGNGTSVASAATASSASVVTATGAASACSIQAAALPTCAEQPLASAAQSFGCGSTDYQCWCINQQALESSANSNIASACGWGGPGAVEALQELCDCAFLYAASSVNSTAATAVNSGATTISAATGSSSGTATSSGSSASCSALVANIPSCGISCIENAASTVGCGSTDIDCLCKNQNAVTSGATSCVVSACGVDQGLKVQSAAQALCSCVSSSGSTKRSVVDGNKAEHARVFRNSLQARANDIEEDECSVTSSGSAATSTTVATMVSSTATASTASASTAANGALKSAIFPFEGLLTAALSFFLAI